ncbi:hypothetical protein ABPG75_007936 [Micractinium tetrahymenae]
MEPLQAEPAVPQAEAQPQDAEPAPPPAGEAQAHPAPRQSRGLLLESPVLIMSGQAVEPSPSTSLMPYPVPLFHSAGRGGGAPPAGAAAASEQEPAGQPFAYPPWGYPRNYIAPSRNRQAAARAAERAQLIDRPGPVQPPPEKPRRESMANDDGYNWRKYGEKQVKGSPFPRSYYKCSHPGCPAKKMIERDPKTGRTSQAELKNEHNHPKPGQVRGQSGRSSYGGGSGGLYRHSSMGPAAPQLQEQQEQQQHSAEPELSSHDLQQEDAVAALTAMKYSPVVPGMLGSAPHDTPTTLLPIPASLRASLEPEDPQANGWAVPHRLHRSSSGGAGAAAAEDRDDSELSDEAYDSELMDSGVDDDEWQPGEDDYRSEPQSTADAAAAAAAAVAMVGRRRAHQDTSGLIMLGKRRRGRQRQADSDGEELYDTELYGDDDEVKVLRNMSHGYKHQAGEDAEMMPAPKRRPRASPTAGALGAAGQRGPEAGEAAAGGGGGGGDERSVVELETDADGMDDGYRWRKYGQKIVKGNPHPRSYYKCTHPSCNVRKQVERSGRNSRMLVTTYEGTHTHGPPATSSGVRAGGRRGGALARRPSDASARPPLPDAKVLLPSMEQLQQIGGVPLLLAQPVGSLPALPIPLPSNGSLNGMARGSASLPPSLQLALANLPPLPQPSEPQPSALAGLSAEAAAAIAAAAAEAIAAAGAPPLPSEQQAQQQQPLPTAGSAAPALEGPGPGQQLPVAALDLPLPLPAAPPGLLPHPPTGEIAAQG